MKGNLEELEKSVNEHENRISKLESMLSKLIEGGHKSTQKKKLSIKEFVLLKKPTDDNLKTLCIGYYLEKYDELSCFNAKDLEKSFRLAKENPPSNINDRVNKNIAKGFMMESEEKKDKKKAYVLTNSGEEFVENDFKK